MRSQVTNTISTPVFNSSVVAKEIISRQSLIEKEIYKNSSVRLKWVTDSLCCFWGLIALSSILGESTE